MYYLPTGNYPGATKRSVLPSLYGHILGIFTLAKTGLASYNIVLSNEQQRVAADKEEQRDAVRLLQTEVNELQERSRVLAAVKEDGIESNQENVYVVGGSEEEE